MHRTKKSVRIAALLGAVALLIPVLSFAQATASMDSFTPSDKDMTKWIIGAIFGNWQTGSEVPLIGSAMRVLNTFALAFGTMMFSYVAVIGTMNSAQDGEILGKKWSSMWIPMRFTIGTTLLVPLSSGYSTIQHAILWLALAGGGAASHVWSAAVSNFAGTEAAAVTQSSDYQAKVERLMRDVLKAEVCDVANQTQLSVNGTTVPFQISTSDNSTSITDPDSGVPSNTTSMLVRWGAADGNSGQAVDACGSATTTVEQDSGVPDFTIAGSTMTGSNGSAAYSNSAMNASAGVANAADAGKKVVQAQVTGMVNAATYLHNTANAINASQSAVTPAQISSAITSAANIYKAATLDSMKNATAVLNQNLTTFTDASKDAGWIMAGSTFFQMAQIHSRAAQVMEDVPTARTGSAVIQGNTKGIADASLTSDMSAMEAQIDTSFKGDSSSWGNPGQSLALVLGKAFSVNPNSSKHALVQIKDTGDYIIVGTEAAAVTMLAATTVGFEAKNNAVGRVGNLLTGIGDTAEEMFKIVLPAIYMGFIACFGVGITMAFLIPFLPFTLTVGSIVGWLMAVFSAVVAGPVWLAGHLHPEGDDIAGKGIGGYMILLETVTRPIFIVFGLIGSFLIMDPVLKLVSLMFKATMSSVQGSSITGIVSIVVLVMLYVSITMTTVRSTMSLVHVLGETVYRWIGGAHAGFDQAETFNQNAQRSSQQAAGGLQQAGSAVTEARRQRVKSQTKPSDRPKAKEEDDQPMA